MKYAQLQERDWQLLTALAQCYRLTTASRFAQQSQIAQSTARRRLDRLTATGFLNRLTLWVSDIPSIEAPLATWLPGDPTPDFGAIAHAAQVRWHDRPIRRTCAYTASSRALALFSIAPRPHIKRHHATHDLAMADCYDYCSIRWPELEFVGEDLFVHERGHGEGVEDAQLVDGSQIVAAVEYAGAYRRERVAHFHHHVSERDLPYYLF